MKFESMQRNPPCGCSKLDLLVSSLRMDLLVAIQGIIVKSHCCIRSRAPSTSIHHLPCRRSETRNGKNFFGAQFADNKVGIGKDTFVMANVHFEDVAPIIIGRDCQIGMEALFVTSHHAMSGGKISKVPDPRPIHVGDRCWIGARAMVLPGVSIGDDCVIAAGSIVTESCAPFGFYAGVPARRFERARSGSPFVITVGCRPHKPVSR